MVSFLVYHFVDNTVDNDTSRSKYGVVELMYNLEYTYLITFSACAQGPV